MAQERFIALLRLRNFGREQKVFFNYMCVCVCLCEEKNNSRNLRRSSFTRRGSQLRFLCWPTTSPTRWSLSPCLYPTTWALGRLQCQGRGRRQQEVGFPAGTEVYLERSQRSAILKPCCPIIFWFIHV